jgi:hypothetical protein
VSHGLVDGHGRKEERVRWECSECGDYVMGAHPPTKCRACGSSVGGFVLASEDDDDVSWTRLGSARRRLREKLNLSRVTRESQLEGRNAT